MMPEAFKQGCTWWIVFHNEPERVKSFVEQRDTKYFAVLMKLAKHGSYFYCYTVYAITLILMWSNLGFKVKKTSHLLNIL